MVYAFMNESVSLLRVSMDYAVLSRYIALKCRPNAPCSVFNGVSQECHPLAFAKKFEAINKCHAYCTSSPPSRQPKIASNLKIKVRIFNQSTTTFTSLESL
mmetsp:Transcript_39577/g.95678  ORF Transcript_39577/g.95678 Transcript_39577/m.95678 type:complete len:101 (+) Transcript_39577:1523-1825(+)